MTRHGSQWLCPQAHLLLPAQTLYKKRQQQTHGIQWLGSKALDLRPCTKALIVLQRPSSGVVWPGPPTQVTPQHGVASVTASSPGSLVNLIIPIRKAPFNRYITALFAATGFPPWPNRGQGKGRNLPWKLTQPPPANIQGTGERGLDDESRCLGRNSNRMSTTGSRNGVTRKGRR